MVKIFNLNLWNYTNWEGRKPKIIKTIKKHDPDIITFQEVRDDVQFNKKGDNQANILNKELNYPHYSFYPVTEKQKENPEKYKRHCIEGTAILSKFPILEEHKLKLRKHKEDKYNCGNLHVKIKAEKIIDLILVHYSNSHYFSLLHLIETLEYVKEKKIEPIIIGDFNMIDSYVLVNQTKDHFNCSYTFKKYISYPSANQTLDYILIPNQYQFKSLNIVKSLSDHCALFSEINLSIEKF